MMKKCFIIEMSTGVDQHGQSATVAATRAVNGRHRTRLSDRPAGTGRCRDAQPDVRRGARHSPPIRRSRPRRGVLAVLPFGQKEIKVVAGGMTVRGHASDSLGDRSDEILVADAAVTVSVDSDCASLRS